MTELLFGAALGWTHTGLCFSHSIFYFYFYLFFVHVQYKLHFSAPHASVLSSVAADCAAYCHPKMKSFTSMILKNCVVKNNNKTVYLSKFFSGIGQKIDFFQLQAVQTIVFYSILHQDVLK